MQRTRRNRGSAFILVVGVMTALAMIGSVFFLITIADRKESVAHVTAAPADKVVRGQIAKIQRALVDDLFIGSDGPYSDLGPLTDLQRQRAYMDYANADATDPFDAFLASTERAWGTSANISEPGRWPKISNIAGYDGAFVTDVDPRVLTSTGTSDNGAFVTVGESWTGPGGLRPLIDATSDPEGDPDAIPLVDADGDRVADSILYPTGVFDRTGEEYFAAVRIVDLSAFVNVNTATVNHEHSVGVTADDTCWMTRGMVDPARMPLQWPWAAFDPTPWAGWPTGTPEMPGVAFGERLAAFPMMNVATNRSALWYRRPAVIDRSVLLDYVRRPGNPSTTQVRPFDWSDEFACRWLDTAYWAGGNAIASFNSNPMMRRSRLSDVVTTATGDVNYWAYYGRHLTTASAGRILARREDSSVPAAWRLLTPAKVYLNISLASATLRQYAFDAYRRGFYQILPDKTDLAERRKMAVQMALNLIDYRDADDEPTVAIVPDDAGNVAANGTVIGGVERQAFITQAWCKIDDPPAGPERKLMAIVLHNPYDAPISISDWRLDNDDDDILNAVDLGGGPIPAGGNLVLYNSPDVRVAGGMTKQLIDTGELDPREIITIYRPGTPLGAPAPDDDDELYVPVGQIDMDAEYSGGALPSGDGTLFVMNVLRDKTPANARIAVAVYDADDYSGAQVATSGINYDSADGATEQIDDYDPSTVTIGGVESTPVFVRNGEANSDFPSIVSVGEVNRIYTVGPNHADGPLDILLAADASAGDYGVGRLDSAVFGNWADDHYPDVPVYCLANDIFTVRSPLEDWDDPASPGMNPVDNDGDGVANVFGPSTPEQWKQWNRETRVIGRVNINTATLAALTSLPYLTDPANENEAAQVAGTLIAYRDVLTSMPPIAGGLDAIVCSPDRSTFASDLRAEPGFASAGEPGHIFRNWWSPRSDYPAADSPPTVDPAQPAYALTNSYASDDGLGKVVGAAGNEDLTKRDLRYTYLANLLAVNSDTYCAYIWVQKGPELLGSNSTKVRRYVVILDRSHCWDADDVPMVRALAEVK